MSSPLSCASPSSETPDLPAGVLGKRKGWDGSEMEMRRTEEELLLPREGLREGEGLLKDTFQNTVVGEGYQHRGVVRQRSGAQGVSIRRYDVAESQDKKQENSNGGASNNDKFLKCKELRDFKKCIAEMLKGAARAS